jgi:hypothetical protein
MPADSVSRAIAAAVPVDTLRLLWRSNGAANRAIGYPRTVRFSHRDSIVVSDVERNSLFFFDTSSGTGRELDLPELEVPYLVGFRGDTLAVFSPAPLRIDLMVGDAIVRSIAIDDEERSESSLLYVAVSDAIYYKRVDPEAENFVAIVDERGEIENRIPLDGRHWRLAGQLRTWGDSLLSLSGFRPVVDVIKVQSGGVDTLALRGFDSPMMARSRLFIRGSVHEAPLLTTSAAPSGDLLFVLNLRAGWLQIDVFDREGMLQYRLSPADRLYSSTYFPQDLDVRETAPGNYQIAVVLSQPQPMLEVYGWTKPERNTEQRTRNTEPLVY